MHDPELAIDILQQISGAAKTILSRFQPINSVEDFITNQHKSHALARQSSFKVVLP